MKKRILSIALVAVMIVAMIPAMLIPTAAIGYYDGYDGATVAEGAITVDGSATPDAAYLAGEKIINRLTYNKESGQTSSFEGYIAADDNGFYFWISVVDESLDKGDYTKTITDEETGDTITVPKCDAGGGDRIELYIRSAGNNADARSTGHIGFDYLGQLTKNARYGAHDVSLVDYATTTTETGWVGEIYVPWEALAAGFEGLTTDDVTSFYIGIQCNNMKNDGSGAHRAYCYDSKKGGSYYRGMFGNHKWASGDNNSGYQGSHLVPVNFVGFKTPVVANALTVDGVKDAAYAKSEAIVPYVTKDGLNYTAYAAATLEGLYIFADIKDATLDKPAATAVDQGDKFQAYFQMGDHFSNANWGYIEMDYTTDADTVNYRYINKGSAWYGPAPEGIEHAYTTNDEGWTAEIFVPWAGEVAINGLSEFSSQAVSIALQANDSTTGAIAYSDRWAERAWYGNNGSANNVSGNFWFAPLTFVFDEDVTPVFSRYAKYVDAITLDGVKDDKYDALAGDKVDHVYVQDAAAMGVAGDWHHGDISLANVYYAFTDTDMYVFVEVSDNTVPQKPDADTAANYKFEYVTIYHSTDDYSGKFCLNADGTQGNAGNYEGSKSYVLYDGTNADKANLGLTYVGTKEAYTGYNVEFKIPLAAADKAALAAGEPINVKIGVEINNAKTDGKRMAYGYNDSNGGAWWVGDPGRGYMTMPNVLLDKNYVPAEDKCTHDSYTDGVCDNCGEACAHEWDDGKVTVAPTHTTEGVKTYTCAVCNFTKTEAIAVLDGHEWGEGKVTVAPTHTTEGVKTYTCECGETKTESIAKLPDHNWGEGKVTVAPTHTTEGVKIYTCECGETKTEAVAKLPDHEWDDGEVTTEPTYSSTGVITYTCPCGETKTEEIPALVIPADATKLVIESQTVKSGDTIKLVVRLENNPGIWSVKFTLPIDTNVFEYVKYEFTGSILADGTGVSNYSAAKGFVCNRASNDIMNNVTDDGVLVTIHLKVKETAAPGDYKFSATIDAKNTIDVDSQLVTVLAQSGVVTVTCNFGDWEQYDADQHVRFCECGKEEYASHDWDDGVITTEPTHITEGVRTFECDCGETKTETVEKLPDHEWDEGKITTEPTHLTEGVKTFTCICEATRTEAVEKLPDHIFGQWTKYDATQHVRTCPCEAVEYADHNWDNGTVTLAPTYVAEGVRTFICTDCTEERTEAIATLEVTASTPKVIIESEGGVVGSTFDLTISLANNPGVWAVAFELPIDTEVFEFVSFDKTESVFDQFGVCGYDETTSSFKFNGYYSDVENNMSDNGTVVTVTLKVKNGVAAGNYDFALTLLENNIIDHEGDRVLFAPIGCTTEVIDYILGDANGDEQITNADTLAIFKYIFDSEAYPLPIFEAADVNCDGDVTNADTLAIFKYIFDADLYPIVRK